MFLVYFVHSLLYQSTLAFSYVARRLPIKKLQCIHTTKRLCITMDSVYELVGLWMTIQTLAWHLNSLDGIGIVADAKVKVYLLYRSQSIAKANMTRIWLKRSFENVKEMQYSQMGTPKPSLKIRTASAICWNYLDLSI